MTIGAGDFERWLDCRSDDADDVMTLLRPPREGEFAWHEVSTRVNRVANDDAQLILPITAEQREAEEGAPRKPAPAATDEAGRAKPAQASAGDAADDGQGSLF